MRAFFEGVWYWFTTFLWFVAFVFMVCVFLLVCAFVWLFDKPLTDNNLDNFNNNESYN